MCILMRNAPRWHRVSLAVAFVALGINGAWKLAWYWISNF